MSEQHQRDRRQILTTGASSLSELAASGIETLDPTCAPESAGPNADYLPNVVVVTHEGRRALFYNDLLLGKTVMISFMSISGESATGTCANLSRVQAHLGERLGRDVFLYSITTEPDRDTPQALAEFASKLEARPGWLFLTGATADLELLRGRFFVDAGHPAGHAHSSDEDCSLGMIRYGNESIGLWGAAPCRADPAWIATRIDWITPKASNKGRHRRRGPVPGEPFPGAVVAPRRGV